MPLSILRNDITKVAADAIVNSANPYPICGGSTEACIYDAAGYEKLLKAREAIGMLEVCEAQSTPAFNLKAKYLIHVSAPRWNDGRSGEKVALKICYQNALRKAHELGCKSIAFPLLSSGVYRFPKNVALLVARNSIEEFLEGISAAYAEDMDVSLVLFDNESIQTSKMLFKDIEDYISAHYIFNNCNMPLQAPLSLECARRPLKEEAYVLHDEAIFSGNFDFDKSIRELFNDPNNLKSFRDRMVELMRERNISSTTIEKDGNIDRKHFSKINSNKTNPSKGAAIAIAIALKLTYVEAADFIAYAGYSLSPSSKSDLIIRFFMENRDIFYREDPSKNKYNVHYLNDCLLEHGENTLGAGRDLKPI